MNRARLNNEDNSLYETIRMRQGIGEALHVFDEETAENDVFREVAKLPEQTTSALQIARDKSQKIVQFETPPSRYLTQAAQDAKTAAVRLAKYWELRKRCFGNGQFILPLVVTGNGACSKLDIEILGSGFFVPLPADVDGRPVVRYDRSKLESDYSIDEFNKLVPNVQRCVCYILSVISENEVSQEYGITIMQIYHSSFVNHPFDANVQSSIAEWMKVLPIRSAKHEIIVRPPRRGTAEFSENVVPALCSTIRETSPHNHHIHVTMHSFTEKLLAEVESRGFERNGIPNTIGGSWVFYREFHNWLRERKVTEGMVEAYLTADKTAAEAIVSQIVRADATRQRRREQDLAYARRKREDTKVNVKQLEKEVLNLRDDGRKLRAESDRLTSLIAVAEEVVRLDQRNRGEHHTSQHHHQQQQQLPLPLQSIHSTALGRLSHPSSVQPSLEASLPDYLQSNFFRPSTSTLMHLNPHFGSLGLPTYDSTTSRLTELYNGNTSNPRHGAAPNLSLFPRGGVQASTGASGLSCPGANLPHTMNWTTPSQQEQPNSATPAAHTTLQPVTSQQQPSTNNHYDYLLQLLLQRRQQDGSGPL